MSSPLRTGTLAPPPSSVRDDPAAGPTWYHEAAPAPALAGVVACRWAGSGGWERSLRLLPDGCADLVWDGHALQVVGALAAAARLPVGAGTLNVGLRLRPGMAGALLGCQASDLPAEPVRLDALWGPAAGRVEERLAEPAPAARAAAGATAWAEVTAVRHPAATTGVTPARHGAPAAEVTAARHPAPTTDATAARHRAAEAASTASARRAAQHRVLEAVVADRLARGVVPDRAVVAAAELLRHPSATVDAVADAVGWSPRELRRRFPAHVGLGPKALQRVLRFQRFVSHAPAVATGRTSLAEAAARCGYADQSHLGRECLRLSASTPARLVGPWVG